MTSGIRIGLIGLTLSAIQANAQSLSPDSNITRLNWHTVNLLVIADRKDGLGLWIQTAMSNHQGKPRQYTATFEPDGLQNWLDLANRIVTTTTPPRDSATALIDRNIAAQDGSQMMLVRRRAGHKWEDDVILIMSDSGGRNSWAIEAQLPEMAELVKTMFAAATRSHLEPAASVIATANPLDVDRAPRMLGSPKPEYPAALLATGRPGEVWLQYIVGEDGTVNPSSIVALLSDDSAFARSAIAAVLGSRFQPALSANVPVPVLVHQRVVFVRP